MNKLKSRRLLQLIVHRDDYTKSGHKQRIIPGHDLGCELIQYEYLSQTLVETGPTAIFRLTANAANLFPSSFRTLLLLVAVESALPFRFVFDFLLSSSNPGG
jgi:hypothetical protein